MTKPLKPENLKIELSTGEAGFIEGSFGQNGKIKIRISDKILFYTSKFAWGVLLLIYITEAEEFKSKFPE